MATADDVPGVIEPLSQEILHSDINWFTVEFAPTGQKNKYEVKFSNKGTGGLTELRENLTADDRIFYGSLQVNLIDGNGSKYDKYVYFKYLPNKANKAKRFLWGFENPIKTSFKFKHVLMEYLDENLVGFDEEGITKEFLRVSENQMEYTSIDFGGNNIFSLQGGKLKAQRPKDMDNQPAQAKQDEKEDIPDEPQAQADPEPQPAAQEEDAKEAEAEADVGGGDAEDPAAVDNSAPDQVGDEAPEATD